MFPARVGAVCVLAGLLAWGCGAPAAPTPGPAAPGDDGGTLVGGVCVGTVESYCARLGGACPAYEESVARHRGRCVEPGRWMVVERHCVGQYRSVTWREPMLGGGEEFFAGDGRLFGAILDTDYTAFCDRRTFSQVFGAIPPCTGEVILTPLCAR